MLFTEKIKDLRLHSQLPQRKLAAALDIDTATYCKIEKGERKARKEQVELLASVFEVDKKELLALWLADKVTDIVSDNGQIARNALSLAVENLEYKEQNDKVKSINFQKKLKRLLLPKVVLHMVYIHTSACLAVLAWDAMALRKRAFTVSQL